MRAPTPIQLGVGLFKSDPSRSSNWTWIIFPTPIQLGVGIKFGFFKIRPSPRKLGVETQ